MANVVLVTLLALIVSAAAEPLILETYPVVAPATPTYYAAGPVATSAYTYPAIQYQAVQAVPATLPYAQVSSYAYGSQVNDYVYRPAPLTAAYTVPYAYSSEYYYRP